jgi:hypothetical protein
LARAYASLDLVDRGASCFPDGTVELTDILLNTWEIKANLSEAATLWCGNMAIEFRDLFLHALAVMHTPTYRTENSGALLSDWPRIPLPATAELLNHSATLGHHLAELLDAESPLNLAAEWSFLAALKLPRYATLEEALKLTAGWGSRGQGSTVMPARQTHRTPVDRR